MVWEFGDYGEISLCGLRLLGFLGYYTCCPSCLLSSSFQEWWTDLWLKEGFATFMEFLSIDQLYPEFHIWDQFVEDAFNPALEMDALENSHPIEVPVEDPTQVHEIFDDISYNKGAAIIRMLHDFLSDEVESIFYIKLLAEKDGS